MSLLEDIKNIIENEDESVNAYEIADVYLDDVETVEDKFLDSGRWVEYHRAVFKRGDEFVALDYSLPATEYQEGSEGPSEAYAVEPYEVTVTKYRKVN